MNPQPTNPTPSTPPGINVARRITDEGAPLSDLVHRGPAAQMHFAEPASRAASQDDTGPTAEQVAAKRQPPASVPEGLREAVEAAICLRAGSAFGAPFVRGTTDEVLADILSAVGPFVQRTGNCLKCGRGSSLCACLQPEYGPTSRAPDAAEACAIQDNLRHIEESLICHANFGRGKEMTAAVAEKILAGLHFPATPLPAQAHKIALRKANVEVVAHLLATLKPLKCYETKPKTGIPHLIWMCEELLARGIAYFPSDKSGRWIGFVQGCMASRGLLNVDAERDRTRPLFAKAYSEVQPAPLPAPVREAMDALTDEQRVDLFSHYCKACGCKNPGCQCWNDE